MEINQHDKDRAENRKQLMKLTRKERFELLFGQTKTIMNETDTPETDAEEFHEAITRDPVVDASFGRKLERERDEARRERDQARDIATKLRDRFSTIYLPWDKTLTP